MGFTKEKKTKGMSEVMFIDDLIKKNTMAGVTHQALSAAVAQIKDNLNDREMMATGKRKEVLSTLLNWLCLKPDDFHKKYEGLVACGAMTEEGAISVPIDEKGKYIFPTLKEIIELKLKEVSLIEYAKGRVIDHL